MLSVQIAGLLFSPEEIAVALGIPSLWFRMEDYADTVRVIAKGIGHGYGMSVCGHLDWFLAALDVSMDCGKGSCWLTVLVSVVLC